MKCIVSPSMRCRPEYCLLNKNECQHSLHEETDDFLPAHVNIVLEEKPIAPDWKTDENRGRCFGSTYLYYPHCKYAGHLDGTGIDRDVRCLHKRKEWDYCGTHTCEKERSDCPLTKYWEE